MILRNILSWMRQIVEAVDQKKSSELSSVTIQIAGIPIEILSNERILLSDYLNRWCGDMTTLIPQARIYMLAEAIQLETIPCFSILELSPAKFHKALAAEGLIATYPSGKGQMQFMDLRKRIAIHMFNSRANLPPWDESAPLRLPFQWILSQQKMRLAHAAAIGIDGKGLVLFGKGGSGKSGTTLAALAVGMNTVGDDYIALGLDDKPYARAVFSHVKQDDAGIARIPGLSNHLRDAVRNWRGKVEFQPELMFAGSFVNEMNLSAAILPSVTQREKTSIERISPAEALLALISSNAQYDPLRPDGGLRFFADVLRKIPCYRMHLSSHALDNGLALKSLLTEIS